MLRLLTEHIFFNMSLMVVSDQITLACSVCVLLDPVGCGMMPLLLLLLLPMTPRSEEEAI